MKFTCSSGQKPLDGYTIKRGIGSGGFGEVYYALSDGGKEVALKLVRGQADIELRGIAQCLNLKHPHLVALYDLKTDNQGDHWVVMEYVAGEPLSTVLNRHPNGLPPELAQQWFLALARAVGYLHDHGIVHRDLKPANIFLENGVLKIGDYGLSKFISSSQRTAQTQSVGTVYYMAPEISTGNYNKQIDVYAAGVVLYEMLTGRVPFEGESAGEILMKHLTSPPDLTKLPAEYIPIVGKALAKNPAQRYSTIGEMAKAVEAIAVGAAAKAGASASNNGLAKAAASADGERIEVVKVPPIKPSPERADNIPTVLPAITPRGQVAELSGSLALAVVLAVLSATLYLAFQYTLTNRTVSWYEVGSLFFLTVGVSWAVLVPAKLWEGRSADSGMRRMVMMGAGGLVGALAVYTSGWAPQGPPAGWLAPVSEPVPGTIAAPAELSVAAGYLSYFALTLFLLRWWKMADRRRSHRFSLYPVLCAAFWALVLYVPFWPKSQQHDHLLGIMAVIAAAVIVQWVSPWEAPPPPLLARRLRLRNA